MQIMINNKHSLLGEEARNRTEAKIAAAFAKFGAHIISVNLSIFDVNGPRGGIDQECRIIVKLRQREAVKVSHTHESLSKAIVRAIGRSERVVARRVQSQSFRRTGHRAGIGLASG